MSVDPLANKYPNVTPYLYCNGNPVMLVDPDGRDCKVSFVGGKYVVSAVYYCGKKSQSSAKQAVAWWNKQQATYTVGEKTYPVKFQLTVKVANTQEEANKDKAIEQRSDGNSYSVEPIPQNADGTQAAGKTKDHSRIRILPNEAENELVGAHEVGHTLMKQTGHTTDGVMAPTTGTQTDKLSQETIDAIVNDNYSKPWYEKILNLFQ